MRRALSMCGAVALMACASDHSVSDDGGTEDGRSDATPDALPEVGARDGGSIDACRNDLGERAARCGAMECLGSVPDTVVGVRRSVPARAPTTRAVAGVRTRIARLRSSRSGTSAAVAASIPTVPAKCVAARMRAPCVGPTITATLRAHGSRAWDSAGGTCRGRFDREAGPGARGHPCGVARG